jgi:UDP-glucose 4-epimerase
MKVLVTGGAGFIGSTVVSACLDAGLDAVVLDDLSKGRPEYVSGRLFYKGSVGDHELVERVFEENPDIDTVIHCAARIVVPESVGDPEGYYSNNVGQGLEFLRTLEQLGCRNFIFSSSGSIYAPDAGFSVDEASQLDAHSPYSRTKVMFEWILEDCAAAGHINVISLRYFNPIGCDPKMRTGLQDPAPTHVLGKLIEAYDNNAPFTVTGVDWPTRDGSAIKDYIHVWDLARAHVAALERIRRAPASYEVINLGTGRGTTVRELVAAFESVTGRPLPVTEAPPRPGDVVGCYTRSDRAKSLLGWTSESSIEDGIRDSMAWAKRRPSVLGR